MCPRMVIIMAAILTRSGHGGVAGEEDGAVAGVVGTAGSGLHLIGTLGGRIAN
jgi:hypothetical protein